MGHIRDNKLNELNLNSKKNLSGDIIYYIDKNKVKEKTIDTSGINKTYVDYIKYLSTSIDYNSLTNNNVSNILIMENCKDQDNCKYAYLEVFDNETP